MNGNPHDNVDITKFLGECGIDYKEETITFNGCCLFMLSAELIKEHTKEYYQRILKAIGSVHKGEYAFERCVKIIFEDKNGL